MALNFNVNPYYDDFDEDKNFHRVLFRPGRAVQARELTQLQTILQNQIDRFGSHIFKEGSRVLEAQIFDVNSAKHIKLQSTFDGETIDISSYDGYFAKGNTTNNVYYIHKAEIAANSDPNTLIVSLRSTGNGSNVRLGVANSENLAIYSSSTLDSGNLIGFVTAASSNPTGNAQIFGINSGVFFTNGNFVKNASQIITLSKYSSNTNTSVGFDVTESIINSENDTSLLDPALGASNYFAPGSDRYRITLTLSKKDVDANSLPDLTTETYIELARYKNGIIVKDFTGTRYADLLDTLAKRTFDESGDYIVEGFDPSLYDYGAGYEANSKVQLRISPGTAYVKGYETSFVGYNTINLDKARDTETVQGYDVPAYYGNYLYVEGANGAVFNFSTAEKVELHKSNTVSSNTKVGEAYVRNLEYVTGNGSDAVYKLSLFDVKQTSNNPITLVKTIINGNSATYTATANISDYLDLVSRYQKTTLGSATNTSNELLVTTPSVVSIGSEIVGANVPEGTFVTAINGSQIVMSNAATGNTTSNTYTFNSTRVIDNRNDSSVFEASYDVIKEFSNIEYDTKRVFKAVSFSSGVASIQTNDGTERFNPIDGSNLQRNYAICIRTGGTGSFPNFTWVDLSGGSYLSLPTPSVGSPATLDIDLGDATFNGTADILATIDITGATRRTKTYVTGARKYFDQYTANTLSIGYADVVNVTAIYISNSVSDSANANANVNVLSSFTFDNGQRDSFYDHATITVKTGETVNTGNVLVIYNRFDHSGTGYFDTLSYPTYDTIPTYTKKDGTIIDLRDSLDFRPIRSANTTSNVANNLNMSFNSQQIVDSVAASVDTDVEYYLSRVDKVILDKIGNFRTLKGESYLNNPKIPADEPDSMTLYKFSFPPYTYLTSDIKIDIVKNKRYTMKDIGSLDDRLTRVEYYTALNLLESDVAKTTFYDDNSNQLFNNGFLVDSFSGHNIGDVFDVDYKCSIDFDNEILRPRFESNGTNMVVLSSSLAISNNNILTLPYTTIPFISQTSASGVNNINPFGVVSFIGYVELDTSSSYWADFSTRPDIVINENGNLDNFESSENFVGSVWGDWNLLSFNQDTSTVFTYYSTEGQELTTTTSSRIKSQDSKSVTDKLLYYAKTDYIDFEIYGYRPNTQVTVYIDGKHHISHLRSYNVSTGTFNTLDVANVANVTVITSDDSGYANGRLYIVPFTDPTTEEVYDPQVTAGQKHLFFCDNLFDPRAISTFAETSFYAANPKKKKANPRPESSGGGGGDYNYTPAPASQNYFIDSNMTLDMATVIIASEAGISYEQAEDVVKVAADAYGGLSSAQQAAGNDSRSGGTSGADVHGFVHWAVQEAQNPGAISAGFADTADYRNECPNGKDPLGQSFYVSEQLNPNGVFLDSVDIFFFSKDTSGLPVTLELRETVNGYPDANRIVTDSRVTLTPDDIVIPSDINVPEATRFKFNTPIYLPPGEFHIVLLSNSFEYNVYTATIGQPKLDDGEIIVSQPYIGTLFKSQNGSTWTADQNSDLTFILNQCQFTTSTAFTSIIEPVGLGYDQKYDVARINIPVENYSNTSNVSFRLGVKANGSSDLDGYVNVIPNADIFLNNRKSFAANTDANVQVSMVTTNADISPVVDVSQAGYILIKNIIDSTAAANVTSFPETLASGGGADSKYITRKVTLKDGFDAKFLRVFLQQNLPSGSSLQVYYKVQASNDSGLFDSKPWVQMSLNNAATNNQKNTEYYDYEYRADNISYTFDDVSYDSFNQFAIKIVFFSTNPANAPTAKNLRVIALA